ncbi:chemotaxis protein W [Agarivorans sp. Toyoura001]|uniref:chemotaxis protein CheW n=1 Tax=Agarivorans sp. Toyoura001 TaxID=2283141 RepID=UPI0010DD2345|nr:chemotaxis protein CheW [Agarivorans sp. Toyoura001]GDY24182.1 chemotaxis protein W [Agarivorans sp. Toyoura001]
MNSDKMMEEALGSYFDSLLTEPNQAPEKADAEPIVEVANPPEPQIKPLAKLFEEAELRVAAVAEAKPVLLPIAEIPEQAPEVEEQQEAKEQIVVEEEQHVETLVDTEFQPASESVPPEWQNIETENDFQVLFFEVAGVTFGVPLTELGGIHRISEVSPLFGKPNWFSGIMIEREQKLSVVDTAKWVMPNQLFEPDYKYLVMLGETAWGLSCEKLFGTERLTRDDVKWRSEPGSRRWLAGMVKQKMCALVHVEELQKMLSEGVNIEGQ